MEKANFDGSLMKERARRGCCPRDRRSGSANILEVSRVGSHEVSEALVSKRATREAEREEMGYGVSHRGGAEEDRRKTPHKALRPGQRSRARTCGGRHSSR